MAGLAQTEFDAWATAVETALGTANSLDIVKNPVPSRVNAEIYQALLKDFQDSWDTWAVNTANILHRDIVEGDSRSRISDQKKLKRTKVDLTD